MPQGAEINRELKSWLLELAQEVPDRVSNMPSGRPFFDNKWLSHAQLHQSGKPQLDLLCEQIEKSANRFYKVGSGDVALSVFSMWSIISRPGMSGKPHDHTGAVSCAYYVDVGTVGEESGGLLSFYLDGPDHPPTHRVVPKAGHIYLFPSSLFHSVSRYQGVEPRIVISANLKKLP